MFHNPYNLNKKAILVTGASSGIGRSIAIECSRLGAQLTLTGRNHDRLQASFNDLNGNNHRLIPCDLSYEKDIELLASEAVALDGLVLNAGILKSSLVRFTQSSDLKELFDTNFFSVALLMKYLLKAKKLKTGASVVVISSASSFKAIPANSLYSASKAALNAYARGAALELAPKNIRVNAILPGLVLTNLVESNSFHDETTLNSHLINYPLGRFGKPEDVAYMCIYLLSDLATWITGSLISVDGGFSLK